MKKLYDFKYYNKAKHFNCFLQFILTLLLIIGLPILLINVNFKFYIKNDVKESVLRNFLKNFSKKSKNAINVFVLSDEHAIRNGFSRQIINNLNKFIDSDHIKNSITIENVRLSQQPKRFLQLKKQFFINEDASGLLISLGNKCKLIQFDSLDVYNINKLSLTIYNTLINLSNAQPIIYWVLGHGELDPKSTNQINGGSIAYNIIQKMNFNVKFTRTCKSIPNDADIIFIPGPQFQFLQCENDELISNLSNCTSIYIGLHPTYEHGLDAFLKNIDIECNGSILQEYTKNNDTNENMLIKLSKNNKLVNSIFNKKLGLYFGLSTFLNIEQNSRITEPYFYSSDKSYAKTFSYFSNLNYDKDVDELGKKCLCAVSDTYQPSHKINHGSGKVVVLGCADWMDNWHIEKFGNSIFLQSLCEFLIDKGNDIYSKTNDLHQNSIILFKNDFLILSCYLLLLPIILLIISIFIRIKNKRQTC